MFLCTNFYANPISGFPEDTTGELYSEKPGLVNRHLPFSCLYEFRPTCTHAGSPNVTRYIDGTVTRKSQQTSTDLFSVSSTRRFPGTAAVAGSFRWRSSTLKAPPFQTNRPRRNPCKARRLPRDKITELHIGHRHSGWPTLSTIKVRSTWDSVTTLHRSNKPAVIDSDTGISISNIPFTDNMTVWAMKKIG